MIRVAKFEKVSFEQFLNDYHQCCKANNCEIYKDEYVKEVYDAIELPKRATAGSAGYDFYLPFKIELNAKESFMIPTGIRCNMKRDCVLQLYPRSGLGFKFRLQLDNTVGIIDSDYYHSDNEGHILAKVTNDNNTNTSLVVEAGKAFMQGVFVRYGVTYDDDVRNFRNGGFGSTDEKNTSK